MSRTHPRPSGPNRSPDDRPTLPSSRKHLGGVVAQAQRTAVEPGDTATLRRVVADAGQQAGRPVGEQPPVAVEGGDHVVEPGKAVGEGGLGGEHAEQPGPLADRLVDRRHVGAGVRPWDRRRGLEPGHVPVLGRRDEGDGTRRRRVVRGRERHVPMAWTGEGREDLVGDDAYVMAVGRHGDPGQLLAAEDQAGGVVRVAQQVRPRARGEVGLQPVQVEAVPAGPVGRAGDHPAADAFEPGEGGRVAGGVDDDAVTGSGDDPAPQW